MGEDGSGKRIRVGRFLGPHGVRGAMKLQALLEEPETIVSLRGLEDGDGRPVRLSLDGVTGQALVVRVKGVETREAAEALGKMALFVPRASLPAPAPDEFYEADLVGLTVADEAGEVLGAVEALVDFGAGPLIEVRPAEGGGTVFLPFTLAAVPEVDLAAGRLTVNLTPGLWPGR